MRCRLQIETARGRFPYKDFNEKCLFAQIELVVLGDPDFLHPGDNYAPFTVHFINRCLTKDYLARPSFEELMLTDFFQHFSALVDREGCVASYVQQMLDLDASSNP